MLSLGQITDTLSSLIYKNPERSVVECFNYLLDNLIDEDIKLAVENYQLLIRVGDEIRNCSLDEQKIIFDEYER